MILTSHPQATCLQETDLQSVAIPAMVRISVVLYLSFSQGYFLSCMMLFVDRDDMDTSSRGRNGFRGKPRFDDRSDRHSYSSRNDLDGGKYLVYSCFF